MMRLAPILASLLIAVVLAGCVRRQLEDEFPETARLEVEIDWSQSNIPVQKSDPTGGDAVHRVSLRFYPQDGSPVFERYLEGNIFEGTIDVPIGRYKIVVMNESVDDSNYWHDAVAFSDVDDFDNFSVTVNPLPAADMKARFPFYRHAAEESVVVEPLRLASWSFEDFEVTSDLVLASRGHTRGEIKPETINMLNALKNIVMRRLTYNVSVTAYVKNLASAQALYTSSQGFADKVYIASGRTAQSPASYLFTLNGREMEDNGLDGTTRRTFLSFGRLPQEPAGAYKISLDISLVNGELHTAAGPLLFDVTDQVVSSIGPDIDIHISDKLDPIELPYVEGGILVDDWDDDIIDLN